MLLEWERSGKKKKEKKKKKSLMMATAAAAAAAVHTLRRIDRSLELAELLRACMTPENQILTLPSLWVSLSHSLAQSVSQTDRRTSRRTLVEISCCGEKREELEISTSRGERHSEENLFRSSKWRDVTSHHLAVTTDQWWSEVVVDSGLNLGWTLQMASLFIVVWN